MKYQEHFSLTEKARDHRIYSDGSKYVRLDFFSHMLRVAVYSDEKKLFPTFSVCPGTSLMPKTGRERLSCDGLEKVAMEEDAIRIDDVEIRIDTDPFSLSYFKDGKPFFHDRQILAYNFSGEMGKGSYHYLSREKGEHIYGLGDKTGDVNKAGRRFRLETFDAMGFDANGSDPLYKQIPFYICKNSVGSYGIYYDTYSNGDMDFGREHNNYYEPYKYARFDEECLVYYVIFGSVEEIVSRFHFLTGKSFLPPKWSFKYCGSTMAYTDSDHPEEALREFEEKCEDYGIDCGGFYLSSGYTQIGDYRCVFHWNRDKFRNPKTFSEEFLNHGIHFLPNVKPAFLTVHPLYEEIRKKGWFLHYKDGTPYVFPFWGGMGSYLDFTNEEAFDFWTECVRRNLVDYGYESIWNDNNEYDIHDQDVYADGFGKPVPAYLIRPLFPLLMSMASNEAIDKTKRHMAVTRSAPAGFERICETWTGDNRTSFEDFRGNHKMAMTASLTGFSFIGQDIGGFAGEKPDEELFLRWIAYGVFTPRFTLHSWNPDGSSTMPWLYPERKEKVMNLFHLREELLPYIYSEAMRAVESYHPLIYPVFLKQEDYDEESDFFFVGDSLLACPVFDKGKISLDISLPKGNWYYQGELKSGCLTLENLPGDLPIYFIKEGSILPLRKNKGVVFELYPLEEGEVTYHYYEDDTSLENPYRILTMRCEKDAVRIHGLHQDEKAALIDSLSRKLIAE